MAPWPLPLGSHKSCLNTLACCVLTALVESRGNSQNEEEKREKKTALLLPHVVVVVVKAVTASPQW